MKSLLISILCILTFHSASAQDSSSFNPKKRAIKIPFKFINNLIFIDVEVNDVPLTFLLDTGVKETILFSLDDASDVAFTDVETINLRGLGADSHIESYKSSGNKLKINNLTALNQEIYIILDRNFNFSSHIGIPVNGIIGFHFFKDNFVEINYDRKHIIISRDNLKHRSKIEKNHVEIPISIEAQKPYVVTAISQKNDNNYAAKALIDTGSSDAIWLFESRSEKILLPESNFDDFLGYGFSGEIHGKRARLPKFDIANFKFDNPIVAFPDSSSIKNIQMVADRVGSVGGEILKRFNIVFDYKSQHIYIRKGRRFDDPFRYNMSGIRLQHDGLQWVQQQIQRGTEIKLVYESDGSRKRTSKYKFELKPVYRITELRKNSPAELSGILPGDILHSINGNAAFRYTLQEIDAIFKSQEERTIFVEVEREDKILNFRFQLKSLL